MGIGMGPVTVNGAKGRVYKVTKYVGPANVTNVVGSTSGLVHVPSSNAVKVGTSGNHSRAGTKVAVRSKVIPAVVAVNGVAKVRPKVVGHVSQVVVANSVYQEATDVNYQS